MLCALHTASDKSRAESPRNEATCIYQVLYYSLQHIDEIPDELKKLYKTVWEISQRTLINMAAERGAYIDQSQSFNVHIAEPNFGKLTSMHFYAWRKVKHGINGSCLKNCNL